ncbi:MAG: stage V sporulation protein AB [Lachnospiraceae bacterium]
MYLKFAFLIFSALGFGLLSSAGVFTVFVSVGLVPRFADKTHTAAHIITYENAIVAGSILGCLFSIYAEGITPCFSVWGRLPLLGNPEFFSRFPFWQELTWGNLLLGVFGMFAGMFVGCIAIAIAEMLNTIPIFLRRISLGKGAGILILSIALGKVLGSFLYYVCGF